jgi:hypothetical protein
VLIIIGDICSVAAVRMNTEMSNFDINRLVGMRSTLDNAFNALLAQAGTSQVRPENSNISDT